MRQNFPRKIKTAALARANGHCEKCRAVLKPGEGEVDHILPDILGGEPVLANAQVLCRVCHAEKTASDIRRTRKADRQRDKANGAVRPKQSIKGKGFGLSAHASKREARAKNALPELPRRNPFSHEVI